MHIYTRWHLGGGFERRGQRAETQEGVEEGFGTEWRVVCPGTGFVQRLLRLGPQPAIRRAERLHVHTRRTSRRGVQRTDYSLYYLDNDN